MSSSSKRARQSNGHGRKDPSDLVAFFPHNRPRNVDEVYLDEHIVHGSGSSSKVYTVADYASHNSSVIQVGRDTQNEDETGMDYAVGIVNKETGEISYRSAKLISFEAVYTDNIEETIGSKKRVLTDYSKDHGIGKDEWFDKKNELAMSFAGTKKMKILEAAKRRTINESTLEEMGKTAFGSEGIKLDIDDTKEKISLINKAESDVLPKFVNAELAKDIYPLSIFISDEEIEELADECKELWSQSKEELTFLGIPDVVISVYRNGGKSSRYTVACTLLAAMTSCVQRIFKSSISKEKFDEVKVPTGIMQKLRLDYLQGDWKHIKSAKKDILPVSSADKERLLAHSLALAITLSPSLSLSITPWAKGTLTSESKLVKIVTALGCTVYNLSAGDAIKMGSIRAARLLSAPIEKIGMRKKFGRR